MATLEPEVIDTTKSVSDFPSDIPPPDSTYAWFVCAASFMSFFTTIGLSNSFAVYQTYYMKTILSDVKPSIISWIGTLSTSMMLLVGVFSSRVFWQLGFRYTIWLGALLGFCGLFAASFCSSVGPLIITQGVIYGIGIGLIYSTAIAVVLQWFEKYASLALGISSSGAAVGGLAFSRILQAIINNIGFRWALRISSFIYIAIIFIAGIILKARLEIVTKPKMIDFSAFKSIIFILLVISGFIGNLGYIVPLFYVPSVIARHGASSSLVSLQNTLFNVGYLVGGFGCGWLGGVIGPLNTFGISLFLCGMCPLIFWIIVTTKWSLTLTSILYGLAVPGMVSQCLAAVSKHFPIDKWNPYNGTYLSFIGTSVIIGNIIIDKLVKVDSDGVPQFDTAAKFSAICYIVSSVIAVPAIIYIRFRKDGSKSWRV
ncbi:hypothetical protein BB560_000065 [Smittium megazygosporum]|uniref:Major facilitator superfamily (MFS) profile domain-containing protein n=1 Tax=Smittium megazygosporum TaxID=133381 RepID=A0A2T9ZLH6_9FUNG|nr:hypothetical protein BB560_000065 [Smittium megazygosporum]